MRILILGVFLFFINHVFSQKEIWTSFEMDASKSVEERTASFVNWWNAQPILQLEDAVKWYDARGIDLQFTLRLFEFEYNESGWANFNKELNYFFDQNVKYKEQVQRFAKNASGPFFQKELEVLKANKGLVVLRFTQNPDSLVLSAVNLEEDRKLKLKEIDSDGVLTAAGDYMLVKKNGKTKKVKLTTVPIRQSFKRGEMGGRMFVRFSDNEEWQYTIQDQLRLAPYIKDFFVNDDEIYEGQDITFTWNVLGVSEIELDHGIGKQRAKWQLSVAPEDTITYHITAKNEFGQREESITVKVDRTKVVKAELTFFTPDGKETKKVGTPIELKIFNKREEIVGRFKGGENIEFGGKVAYAGPFLVDLNPTVLKKDLTKAHFDVSIPAEFDDTYIFSPILILHFSDGSKRELYGFGNKTIDNQSKVVEFKFSTF
jgi:hypothetical protein